MPIYRVKFDASGTSNDGTSWENAYTDLQLAIDAATQSEDQIWVAAGTYKPTEGSDRNLSFDLPDGVTIYGGFAGIETAVEQREIKKHVTILSGEIGEGNNIQDNSYTVVKFTNENGSAILDGFTIQYGNSNKDIVTDNSPSQIKDYINNNGGGVHNQGNLTLRNVVVKNNQANADGGGIRNNGTLTIENSEISNNQAIDNGGGIRNQGTITIIDSTIADNTSVGDSDTSGGGGLINTGALATIINSTFSGNTGKNGGAIRNDTVLNLINSTLSGNTAAFTGGGLVNTISPDILITSLAPLSPDDDLVGRAEVTITNSTITKNTASLGNASGLAVGSGIANFAIANISNSIIADNTNNDDIAHIFTIERTIPGTDTVIPVTVTGKNNSGGNNLMGNGEGVSGFTDGNNGDQVGTKATPIDPSLNALADNGGATQTHALKEGSRAIDAGDNSKIAEDKADLDKDGNTTEAIPFEQRGEDFKRIVGDAVDIGAVEFVGASSSPSNIIINEILADPPSGNDGDANGDGTRDGGDDEFIELVNNSDSAIDISGWTLSDGSGVKHTFPSETIVPANGVILVFGGGTPTGNFGGAIVQTASTRSLSLNNSGDTVTLNNGTKDIASYTYGDEGGNNQSLTRNPDITGDFIQHSQATNSGGALFSPGTTLGNTTPPPSANPGIAIAQSENTTNVTEGGATDSYTAVLNSEPISDVTVTISSNGETTTDLATLTFTTDNWNTPQTVTVTAVYDDKVENDHRDTITHTVSSDDNNYNNINIDSITVNITDNNVEDNNSNNPNPTELTPGKDRFQGTATDDNINSLAGKDFLKGGEGNDVLDAGADNDRVYGGIGEDTISGGTGNDYLNGGTGKDSLDGGEGKDRLYGGDGDDTITGGAGNDFLKGDNGNDSLDGGEGRDRLYGGDGNDTLNGGSGNDRIEGGDGIDMITGVNTTTFGVGEVDRLKGNADADIFVLGNTTNAFYDDGDNTKVGKSDYALIEDFKLGEDIIQLFNGEDNYYLGATSRGTNIFIDNDGVEGLSRNDELIGVIRGVKLNEGMISDSTQGFNLV